MPDQRTIEWTAGQTVTAVLYPAAADPAAFLVLAHGAGANQFSSFMTGFAAALARLGITVATFNFPYMEGSRKPPDRQPVLDACYRGVLAAVAAEPELAALPLFIGGKSLGGRLASHLAADPGAPGAQPAWWPRLRGLVFLGYPLHPPARPQQVRVSHLPRITHPMLFVQGERDAFGTPVEIQAFTDVLPARCTLVPVPGGDHSFDVLKRSGLAAADVLDGAQRAVAAWINRWGRVSFPQVRGEAEPVEN